MPYISCNTRIFNVSDKEAMLLEILKEKINYSYAPAKLNYSIEDLITYYLNNEQSFIQTIHNKLNNFDPSANEDKLNEFERIVGYPVTQYLSTRPNGKYSMHNINNTFFNVLFLYFFMDPIDFKKIAKDNLKDQSVFTPIKNVIKDAHILSLIYPNGYDNITVYDFLKKYSFSFNSEKELKSINGIGPVSYATIQQSLSNFGYPLMQYQAFSLMRLQPNVLDKILLSTTEELENAGIVEDVIEELKRTNYINNKKTIQQTVTSSIKTSQTNETALTSEVKNETKPKNTTSSNDKYLELISKMPKSIIKSMIIKEFKSNLKLLLDLGKQKPQLLLDYAECIPFKRYQKMEDIPQVITIIRIQPKLIRKLQPRMISLIQANLTPIIFSNSLTKGEQDSLNSYVNNVLNGYYANVVNKGIKTKNR